MVEHQPTEHLDRGGRADRSGQGVGDGGGDWSAASDRIETAGAIDTGTAGGTATNKSGRMKRRDTSPTTRLISIRDGCWGIGGYRPRGPTS